jgi:NADH dehydrogenase FAD-containing subunit
LEYIRKFHLSPLQQPPHVTMQKKDRMFHNIGGPRALVEVGHETKLFIPYTRILKRGRHVRGSALSINSIDKTVLVRLAAGAEEVVPYDFLVIATGQHLSLPSSSYSDDSSTSMAKLAEVRAAVAKANRVTIVGGGAVGIEVAGEIKTDFPTKQVTLIHSGDKLLSSINSGNLSTALKTKLVDKLRALGVVVSLCRRVNRPETPPTGVRLIGEDVWVGTTDLYLSTGPVLTSDLTIFTTGGQLNNSFMSPSLSSSLNAAGHIKVEPTFQVHGHTDMFAIGDITDMRETKTGYVTISQHVPRVAHNILALISKGTAAVLKTYAPAPSGGMLITVGRNGGAGQLGTMMAGNWLVRNFKAGDLMTKRFNKELGYSKPGVYTEP